ncbi:MAG: hypothetical protein WBB66_00375, partial [Candidatus Omnitrophota bacterium]
DFVESFDLAGSLLTTTRYEYDASGAIDKTATYDPDDNKLSETTYRGVTNREKVDSIVNFDLSGNLLTTTSYEYRLTGAIERTTTTGSDGVTLSEAIYEGEVNSEKIDLTRSFDLLGELLTTTGYFYLDSGAIERQVTYDPEGRKLSETRYEGAMNREKAVTAESFNLAGEKLTTTDYQYDTSSGALLSSVVYDSGGVKLSETEYSGLMNREKAQTVTSFRDDGLSVLNITTYEYDSSGAMSRSITENSEGKILSETVFQGLWGSEKSHISNSYDSAEDLKSITHYVYGNSGALERTETNQPDDVTRLSETHYRGLSSYEVADFTLNFRDDATVRNSIYYFYKSFAGFADDGSILYTTERAENAFREDPLVRAETYEGGDAAGSTDDLLLESAAYYRGNKNKEVIDFSQEYEFKPNSETERQIKSTTVYEYGDKRELLAAYTYFGGNEVLLDTSNPDRCYVTDYSDLKRKYVARYQGERGREKMYEMEGTICEYPLDDLYEWDYFIRTDFRYDDPEDSDRNTGYFERIFVPDQETGWDWESDNEGVLAEAKDVIFSLFDEKDRYGKIEKIYKEWIEPASEGEEGRFELTGERVIQEEFVYDDDNDDNIMSYRETNIDREGDEKWYRFEFSDYSNKKPGIIRSVEL